MKVGDNTPLFPVYRHSTENVPEGNRLGFLHDFIARHIGGRRYSVPDRNRFRVDSASMPLTAGLTLARVSSTPMRGVRTRDLLQDNRDDYLLVIHNDEYEISIDGKASVKVCKGDAVLLNEGNCSDFCYPRPNSAEMIWLSRRMLTERAPRIDSRASYLMPRMACDMPLLAHYARLTRRHPPASVQAGDMAARHLYDLMAAALHDFVRGGTECNEVSKAAARLQLVQRDVLENLADPELRIDAIARRQGVTPRYIQRLFESEGTTFTEFVRNSRLDCAWRRLKEAHAGPVSVTALAYACGFSDLSTFSRAFRERFKATPSEVRHAAS
jgi:AraC-like DNA-binding protein